VQFKLFLFRASKT